MQPQKHKNKTHTTIANKKKNIKVLLMKIGFYLIGSVVHPPVIMDIVCYSGYKLIFVVLNLALFSVFHSDILYYIFSVTTGVFFSFQKKKQGIKKCLHTFVFLSVCVCVCLCVCYENRYISGSIYDTKFAALF